MEPTTTGTNTNGAPPKEVVDALSTLIGAGVARTIRVVMAGVVNVAAHAGLGIGIAGNPLVAIIVESAVTGAIHGVGKVARDGKFQLGTKVWTFPGWVPRLPGWFPI